MDKTAFWKLIDASRRASQGDPEEQIEALQEELSELPPEEIVEFGRIFSEYHSKAYTWPLWGAAYVIGGGCSDDGFMDFRGWLISKGEKAYEAALEDPESLISLIKEEDGDGQIEGFQYVASQAWEDKTGKDSAAFPVHDVRQSEEPAGEPWTEDEVEGLYPKLTKKFG